MMLTLEQLIEKHTKQQGSNNTAITELRLSKTYQPTLKVARIYSPCLCLIVKGKKEILLDKEVYVYAPSEYMAVSVDLPLTGQVTKATKESPYLGLQIDLDPHQISELIRFSDNKTASPKTQRGLIVGKLDPALLNAIYRLVNLLETPQDIAPLAPLILREIYYRLLQTSHGAEIAQLLFYNTHAKRIANCIQKIKDNIQQSISVEELAQSANMSVSSFHTHFKQITAMSPLQYQKRLRLTEARRILINDDINVAEAAYLVGYESPTQFNREYTRLFGTPPKQDIATFKLEAIAANPTQ